MRAQQVRLHSPGVNGSEQSKDGSNSLSTRGAGSQKSFVPLYAPSEHLQSPLILGQCKQALTHLVTGGPMLLQDTVAYAQGHPHDEGGRGTSKP